MPQFIDEESGADRITDTENQLVVTTGEREVGRGTMGEGSKRYKLLGIK